MSMTAATQLVLAQLGTEALTAGFSLIEAQNQKEILNRANLAAQKYVSEAKRQAQVNAQKLRSVDQDLYSAQTEALSQNLSQVLEQVSGGDYRTALSLAPRLGQQLGKAQQKIDLQRKQDVQNLEKDIADEEQNIAQRLQDIAEGRAEGAQVMASQAEDNRTQSRQAGFEALAGAGVTGFQGLSGKKTGVYNFADGTYSLKDPTLPYDASTNPFIYTPKP